jgi:hypothetical protein
MSGPVPAARSQVLCSAWATPADVPEPYRSHTGMTDEIWERLLMQASEILWALSGRRWYGGGCEETATLRSVPPTPGRANWPYDASWGSCACWATGTWIDDLLWPPTNWGGDHLAPTAVHLPRDPVTAVVSVTVDGELLDPSAYRLTRAGWVERLTGTWDVCGDVTDIVYQFGEPPPEGGVQAAVQLAIQLMLDLTGDSKCRLPQRVTSITRQGISMSMIDPMDFLPDGRTGFYLTDLWLASVNPHNRPARGSVWSLDIPTTATGGITNVP